MEEKLANIIGAKLDNSRSVALARTCEEILSKIGESALKSRSGREFVISNEVRARIDNANNFGNELLYNFFESSKERIAAMRRKVESYGKIWSSF